jgi:hypothetical protein
MHRSARLAALTAAGVLTLSGCSLASDVSMSPHIRVSPSARATAAPVRAKTVAAKATAQRTPGDLDTGAVTHQVAAGAYTMVIDYWTTQSAATWTSATPATIQLSAHIESRAAVKQWPKIDVTRFSGTFDDGSTLQALTSDVGTFVLTPPFSYGSALLIPGTSKPIDSATVTVQFDLLIETAPGSGQFFRQTVIDALHLSFAPEETSK